MPVTAMQANIVKQLAKLVKVRYVEDITDTRRVGPHLSFAPRSPTCRALQLVRLWASIGSIGLPLSSDRSLQ